jgi:hypothetical protein
LASATSMSPASRILLILLSFRLCILQACKRQSSTNVHLPVLARFHLATLQASPFTSIPMPVHLSILFNIAFASHNPSSCMASFVMGNATPCP